MKQSIKIGVAVLLATGTALVGTSLYAANDLSSWTGLTLKQKFERRWDMNMFASLSGSISPAALTEFQSLMDAHKAKIDTLRLSSSGGVINSTAIEALQAERKASMDALLLKYPELKNTLPGNGMNGKWWMGKFRKNDGRWFGENNHEAILSTLPEWVQSQIKTIRESYKAKIDTLRTEEKAALDAVIAAYPEVKAKLDTLEVNRPMMGGGFMGRGEGNSGRGHGRMMNRAEVSGVK